MPPSSRGLGRRPFKPKTGVRISVGALAIKEVIRIQRVAFLIHFFAQSDQFFRFIVQIYLVFQVLSTPFGDLEFESS